MKLAETLRKWFSGGTSRAERQLLDCCFGDVAQADRLIRLELALRPQLTRDAASRSALDRWSREH